MTTNPVPPIVNAAAVAAVLCAGILLAVRVMAEAATPTTGLSAALGVLAAMTVLAFRVQARIGDSDATVRHRAVRLGVTR